MGEAHGNQERGRHHSWRASLGAGGSEMTSQCSPEQVRVLAYGPLSSMKMPARFQLGSGEGSQRLGQKGK